MQPDYRANEHVVRQLERVRALRRDGTTAEQLLWQLLRGRRLAGLKFRRQHQFGPYILDCYCPERRLAVELDGSQHLTAEGLCSDRARTEFLENNGIRVLRFINGDVLQHLEGVAERIAFEATRSPHPGPLPEGEGEG